MGILSELKKIKRYEKESSGYKLLSQWTSSQTVEMEDGTTLQHKMKSVDDSLASKAPTESPNLTGTPKAPTAPAGTNTTQLATTAFVQSAVGGIAAASDAMVMKGTLGTDGTITALPTTYKTGWTYRVVTDGTYAGQVCEIGDLIIALIDRDNVNNQDSDWCVAQTNINGAITGIKSGDTYIDCTQTGSSVTISHKDTARTDTAVNSTLSNGDNFTAIKAIKSDSKGHITDVETETIALSLSGDGDYLSKTNTEIYVPTSDYHPATKQYVDDALGDIGAVLDTINKYPGDGNNGDSNTGSDEDNSGNSSSNTDSKANIIFDASQSINNLTPIRTRGINANGTVSFENDSAILKKIENGSQLAFYKDTELIINNIDNYSTINIEHEFLHDGFGPTYLCFISTSPYNTDNIYFKNLVSLLNYNEEGVLETYIKNTRYTKSQPLTDEIKSIFKNNNISINFEESSNYMSHFRFGVFMSVGNAVQSLKIYKIWLE